MKDQKSIGLQKHKCCQCGKIFESRREYAYKISDGHVTDRYFYFCSWKCLRAYEHDHTNWKKKKEIAYQLNIGEKKEDIYESAV